MKKNIETKKEAVTKDYSSEEKQERTFTFPSLGVSVKAASYKEALQAAKAKIKTKK